MSRLTRDGTAEPVSRDQTLRHVRGQGKIHFRCSADLEQDWQPYPVEPYSAICDDHTYYVLIIPLLMVLAVLVAFLSISAAPTRFANICSLIHLGDNVFSHSGYPLMLSRRIPCYHHRRADLANQRRQS